MLRSKVTQLTIATIFILTFFSTGCGTKPVETAPTTISTQELTTSLPVISVPTETAEPIPDQSAASHTPTIILYNGNVLTMDPDLPRAEAIAIQGDHLLAVGKDEDILTLQTSETLTLDLQGNTIMPGFVDPHTHILNDAGRFFDNDSYEKAQQLALQNGITTIGDMWVDSGFLAAMQAMDRSGQLRLRTSLYLGYDNACGELMGDWYQQFPPTREAGEMLRIGGIKVMADGGVCGAWARSYELPGFGYGDLWFTQDEMNSIIKNLDAAGYQLAIHAIGDRAVEQVLNALELTLAGRPNTLRHRIEHSATLRPDLISRYSEIDVVATIFGSYPNCDVEESPPPPERINDYEWPYRDLLLANPDLHIAWHGDYPWMGPVAPLLHLYSMVTPHSIFRDDQKDCDDPTWWTGRTFSVDEVLPMMTIEGAYALFRDEEVGSLETGKFADLIVLSGDPTTIDPLEIKDLEVWMTMVGGNVEWCAPAHEALCPNIPTLPSAVNTVTTPIPAPLADFRDDFINDLQTGWTLVAGNDSTWNLAAQPGFLNMELASGSQPSTLLVRNPDSENFQIITRLIFTPTSNYQFAGLSIYQDTETKVQLGRAYCDTQTRCIGNGIYFDAVEASQPRVDFFASETLLRDEAFLRIDKAGALLTGYYSEDGESWTLIGEYEIPMMNPKVGLIAGQSSEPGAVALFDYFALTILP